MSTTLYETLQIAENVNNSLRDARGRYIDAMRGFSDAPGIIAVAKTLPDEPLPQISVQDYQRQIIQMCVKNPVLDRALRGKKTVTRELEEIAARNPPRGRVFPRAENMQHNQEVEQIGELVGGIEGLKMKGYIEDPSLIVGAGLGLGLTSAAAGALYSAMYLADVRINWEAFRDIWLIGMPATATFCGTFIGYFFGTVGADKLKEAEKQANYIDRKITELYPRKTSVVVPSENPVVVEDL